MGVSPKVQPIYIGSHKTLGYTVLMGVSPKVQPIYIGSHKTLGYTVLMGVSPKEEPMYLRSQKCFLFSPVSYNFHKSKCESIVISKIANKP